MLLPRLQYESAVLSDIILYMIEIIGAINAIILGDMLCNNGTHLLCLPWKPIGIKEPFYISSICAGSALSKIVFTLEETKEQLVPLVVVKQEIILWYYLLIHCIHHTIRLPIIPVIIPIIKVGICFLISPITN